MSGRWEELKDTEDVEELRRFIQRRPDDFEASEASARITAIEYRQAKDSGTRYAFAAFVERHPDSSEAIQARRQLERLDWEAALAEGSAQAYQAFLRAYPTSQYSEAALAALEKLLCAEAQAAGTRAALERLLAERPDIACHAELDEARRRIRHAEAQASASLRPALEFVADYPEDPRARGLRSRLQDAELGVLLRAGRFELARERVLAQADAAQAPEFTARLAAAERAWAQAAFAERGATRSEAATLKRLAEDTRLVRAASQPALPLLTREQDPRKRWLQVRSLASWPDEAAADALLESLADAYLAVQEEAWRALAALVSGFEPLRAEAWLAGRRLALAPTAQSGPLLLRLSALAQLAGDAREAESLLDRLLAEQEPPDLFALHRVHALAVARGDSSKAASLASRFSDAAADFARRRREAWGQTGAELRDSGQGFLVLRQLEGVARVWEAVLAPYRVEPLRADPRAATLGPWLERSAGALAELRGWLGDEEARWGRAHPGYLPGLEAREVQAPETDPGARQALVRALFELALLGGPRAAPTLEAAACCAPPPWLRLMSAAARVAGRFAWLASPPTPPP
jgi:hypothetical protein